MNTEYCLFLFPGTNHIDFWSSQVAIEHAQNHQEFENIILKNNAPPIILLINIDCMKYPASALKVYFDRANAENFMILFVSASTDERLLAHLLAIGPADLIHIPYNTTKVIAQLDHAYDQIKKFKKSNWSNLGEFLYLHDSINILYVDFDLKMYSERALILEGLFNVKVSNAISILEMKRFLQLKAHYQLIIFSEHIPLSLLNIDFTTPMLILLDPGQFKDQKKEYELLFSDRSNKTSIFYIAHSKYVDFIRSFLEKKHKENLTYSDYSQGFCRVRPEHFFRFQKNPCDIFIKIGGEKFIKILNQYDLLTSMDIENKSKDKFKYVYIKRNDFVEFYENLSNKLESVLNFGEHLEGDLLHKAIICGHELITESIRGLGLNNDNLLLGQKIVHHTMMTLKKMNDLEGIIYSQFYKEFYKEKVSIFTCYIAGGLLSAKSWCKDSDLMTLGLASMLCDIDLNDVADMQIRNQDQLNRIEDVQRRGHIFNHPQKALEYLNGCGISLPNGLIEIISQHHEQKDGTGFPYGLNGALITPLSHIFIIANDFAHFICTRFSKEDSGNSGSKAELLVAIKEYTNNVEVQDKLTKLFQESIVE